MTFKEEIAKDIGGQYNVHDGLKDKTIPELKEICDEESLPFAVCAISVTGDLNIGSIIRTSSLFGAEKVIVVGRKKFDRRGLVGANNYIDIEFVPSLNNDTLEIDEKLFVDKMNADNYTPIFVEQGGYHINSLQWKNLKNLIHNNGRKICIVVGNENRGIPDNILATASKFDDSLIVSIAQCGVLRSHNVSVATGIVLNIMTSKCFG